jgi:thioredoxin-related protein
MKPPLDLRRGQGAKPLAVVFETPYCAGCDELHREGFRRPEVEAQLAKFDVARISLLQNEKIIAPDGKTVSASEFARSLKIVYTPSIVFFDRAGREVFRIEAYLRPFHLAGSFAYVSSGAYLTQPSFQRFLQAKAERMRARGEKVQLWK